VSAPGRLAPGIRDRSKSESVLSGAHVYRLPHTRNSHKVNDDKLRRSTETDRIARILAQPGAQADAPWVCHVPLILTKPAPDRAEGQRVLLLLGRRPSLMARGSKANQEWGSGASPALQGAMCRAPGHIVGVQLFTHRGAALGCS
jgi:hypothetical protein